MHRIKASVLHGYIWMGIDIKCDSYISMAKHRADDLGIDILREHPRGVGVPKIVKAHGRHITEGKKPPEAVI